MLDTVDLNARLDAEDFKTLKAELRARLNQAQVNAWQANLGVVIVIEGWDYSGKADVTRFLAEPLDPRGLVVNVMYPPTREERLFPIGHRYATRIPARKQIGLFVRSWYYHALDERVRRAYDPTLNQLIFQVINNFEQTLACDGYLILKFWLHLDRKEAKRRRKEFRKDRALQRLRTGPDDPKQRKRWEKYTTAVEEVLTHTNTEFGRWHAVAATDVRYAQASIARIVCEQIERTLAQRPAEPPSPPPAPGKESGPPPRLELTRREAAPAPLTEKEYEARLAQAQVKLTDLHYRCVEQGRSVLFALEGWDAAGKGGIIRRLTAGLDPRFSAVHPIAAPTPEEGEHHYLWRFWKRIPPAGHWAVFDRTWYGRVLVERVEGFAKPLEWQRAYREINTFEASLIQHGAVLLKYFLDISPQEQLRRFQAREEVPYKQFKITPDDWRNREKRGAYVEAIEEMLERTSPPLAPWKVIDNNDKHLGRILLLEDAINRIEAGLRREVSPLVARVLSRRF